MSNNHGGKREGAGSGGARPGAGRPKTRFNFGAKGDGFVIERGMVNELPSPPEVWKVAAVHEDYFELERVIDGTSEIMTISKIDFWNGEQQGESKMINLGKTTKVESTEQEINGFALWQITSPDEECYLGNGNMSGVTVAEALEEGELWIQVKTGNPLYGIEPQTSEQIYDRTMKRVRAEKSLARKRDRLAQGLAAMDRHGYNDKFTYDLQTTLTQVNKRRGLPIEKS